jgi:hypothetical protein
MSTIEDGASEAAPLRSSPTGAEDDTIRALLKRLARPDGAGGEVLERAALLAEGSEFPAIMAWITDHAGIPETAAAAAPGQGLHGSRMNSGGGAGALPPRRYVLPAGTLG